MCRHLHPANVSAKKERFWSVAWLWFASSAHAGQEKALSRQPVTSMGRNLAVTHAERKRNREAVR